MHHKEEAVMKVKMPWKIIMLMHLLKFKIREILSKGSSKSSMRNREENKH